MVSPSAVEVAKTVLEVADVAWTAVECSHHLRHHGNSDSSSNENDENLESLRSENRRLRSLLEKNLVLLHKLSQSPSFLNDCPPDLQGRLVDTLRSDEYLTQLKRLQRCCIDGGNEFPFKEATELDYQSVDILISVDSEEPSWWVWVKDEVELSNVEEWSGIDDENYVVIGEEHVVDGVANFMAKCILSNPKARVCSHLYGLLFLFAVSNFVSFILIAEFVTRGTTENFIEGIGWRKQTGKGNRYLACREDVLCTVYLGTSFGWIVQKPCGFKTCC